MNKKQAHEIAKQAAIEAYKITLKKLAQTAPIPPGQKVDYDVTLTGGHGSNAPEAAAPNTRLRMNRPGTFSDPDVFTSDEAPKAAPKQVTPAPVAPKPTPAPVVESDDPAEILGLFDSAHADDEDEHEKKKEASFAHRKLLRVASKYVQLIK